MSPSLKLASSRRHNSQPSGDSAICSCPPCAVIQERSTPLRPNSSIFLVGVSPAERQALYRTGLDALNTRAKKQYNKTFADLDAAQCDAIVRPLLVPVPWTHEPPKDSLQHFIAAAHDDIRTATRNSREWNTSGGRRGGGQLFWNAIDPIYKG